MEESLPGMQQNVAETPCTSRLDPAPGKNILLIFQSISGVGPLGISFAYIYKQRREGREKMNDRKEKIRKSFKSGLISLIVGFIFLLGACGVESTYNTDRYSSIKSAAYGTRISPSGWDGCTICSYPAGDCNIARAPVY